MKQIAKATNIVLVMLMLLTQTVFSVQAKSENKKPDPSFRDKATHIEKSHKPYYGKNAVVDTYELDGIYYSVDASTGEVAEIIPDVINYEITATYTEDQLQDMAESIVVQFLGEKVDLSQMTFSLGQKIGTYFFRWEDQSKKLDDSSTVFVQVGLSQNGDFLNLFNTLPFGHGNLKVHAKLTRMPNLIGPFNQIYANGGAYWSQSTGMNSATGGYYYLYPSSACTASHCSKFFYKSGSNTTGGWFPNANTNTRASVFIPSTHAVGTTTYVIKRGNLTTFNSTVNQNLWFNTWVSITSSTVTSGIVSINMTSTSSSEVAWDEAWVYNP